MTMKPCVVIVNFDDSKQISNKKCFHTYILYCLNNDFVCVLLICCGGERVGEGGGFWFLCSAQTQVYSSDVSELIDLLQTKINVQISRFMKNHNKTVYKSNYVS